MAAMCLRKFFWLALFAGVLGVTGRAVDGARFPERKIFQFGEFVIEASAGDEAYVEALALKLADYKPAPPAPPPAAKLSLEELQRRRDYFLGRVAASLGLDQPTEKMASTFDLAGTHWRTTRVAAPAGVLRHYALWRRPELVARLQAGERVAGFTLDSSGGLDFSFEFKVNSGSGDLPPDRVAAGMANYWDSYVCPIKIGATPEVGPAEEVAAELDEFMRTLFASSGQQMQLTERQAVFNVLRETTESGVVWHYLTSKDRRWFCEGIANYVAGKVIRDELGPEAAKSYYDLPAELKKYEGEAARVDLVAWPAAENPAEAQYAEELNTASHAFATKVIADVSAKHGDDFLPKWFAEIGRTKREKATMETVFKAYRRLT